MAALWLTAVAVAALAGFLIGRSYQGAHDARQQFSAYRVRVNANLNAWIASAIRTAFFAAALLGALYVLYRMGTS